MPKGHIMTASFHRFNIVLLLFCFTFARANYNVTKSLLKTTNLKDPHLIPYISETIKIDGDLTEEVWQQALVVDLPYETNPGENIPAPVKTDALLIYNNSYLYIGFRAHDPDPESIRARYTDRDRIWNDDYVAIFLDTFNDERRCFAFRSNPLGIQSDDIELPSGQEISWDAIYESEGRITDWGYSVEMAIPFNQLRFQRTQENQVWGINLMRIYPRNVAYRIDAVPLDRNNDSMLAQFLRMEGFKEAKPGKNIEIVPSFIGAQTDHRPNFPDGDMERASRDGEVGISARWGFTPNLMLNGTINPDFSQVEADAYQLDINEPFALWYPEKRPFFQEGFDYFETLKSAVYTRVMRNPSWGVKLSGKEGSHTVGGYVVRDDMTNLIFPGNQGSSSASLGDENLSTVLRYKKDFGQNVTFGLMGTDREGTDYYNRLVSMDGDIRITDSDRVRFQAMGSSTQYPDAVADAYGQNRGSFSDYFFAFEFDHSARNWGYWLDVDDVGTGFRADLGFIPMVDFRNVEGGVNYTFYGKPGGWWSRFHISSQLNYYENRDGNPLKKNAQLLFHYTGTMQSHAHAAGYITQEAYGGGIFDLTSYSSCFGFRPVADVWFHAHVLLGDRIDYDNTRLGRRFRIDPEISLNIGRHMQFEFYHLYERMSAADAHLFTANISQMTVLYHLNVRAFFRAILQYVNYDYNVQNYTIDKDPEFKQLFSQLLFSYKINPFTVFFLGYSDNHMGGLAPSYNLRQKDRTFFMKLSYAWVR